MTTCTSQRAITPFRARRRRVQATCRGRFHTLLWFAVFYFHERMSFCSQVHLSRSVGITVSVRGCHPHCLVQSCRRVGRSCVQLVCRAEVRLSQLVAEVLLNVSRQGRGLCKSAQVDVRQPARWKVTNQEVLTLDLWPHRG